MIRTCPLLLIALFSPVAMAAQTDDRLTFRAGVINLDSSNTLRGSSQVNGEPFNFNEDFKLGGKEREPRVDVVWRMGDRHRLIADYFRYNKQRVEILDESVSYGEQIVPQGSFIRADLTYQIGSLIYDYALINNDDFQLGLQLGAEYARVGGVIDADLGELYSGRAVDEKADGAAPVVGARLSFTPGERWLINLQGQYLDTDWGSFDDYDGSLSRANAIIEYRFTEHFGMFVGYDWFRLDVDQTGRDGLVGLKQEFKGPMAGITLGF